MSMSTTVSAAWRTLGVGGWLVAVTGPILDKELRVTSRRRFTYVLRVVYLVLLAALIGGIWLLAFRNRGYSPLMVAAQMAEVGKAIVGTVAIFQFIALPLMAILVLSGSISEEVDRRTLGVLLSTPVTALQVVSGKLASRLLHLVLLVAAGLPVMILVRVLGGVPAEYVLASTCLTLSTTILVGTVTLYLSIKERRPWRVTLKAFALAAFVFALVPLMVIAAVPNYLKDPVAGALTYVNPPLAMIHLTGTQLAGQQASMFPAAAWYFQCLIYLGASFAVFWVAVARVRRAALVQAAGDEGMADASRPGRGRAVRLRRVHGSPVLWKEIRRRSFRARWKGIVGWGLAIGGLLVSYGLAGHNLQDRDVRLAYGVMLFALGALGTAIVAAPVVTTEKETQTLLLLLATPLGSFEIILGKAVGALLRCVPIWSLLVAHLAIMTLYGYQSSWTLLHGALLAAGTAAFTVGIGLVFSVFFRRSTGAVVASLLTPIFLWGVLPGVLVVVGELLRTTRDEVELLACFDPAVLMGILMLGTQGRAAQWNSYEWPSAIGYMSMPDSTMVIFMISMTYAALGAGLAAVAADRLRRRAVRG
jgi:ABC-type transport system involved in multi-copper enzyme maturation permease subunit